MSTAELIQLANEALYLTLILSLPTIVAASLVGTLTSLVQALTQIQEQTLSFVLKLIAVVVTLMITGNWMGQEISTLTDNIFKAIGG
ncbi:MAG: type III secretion system export apparatus subunit SctS [Pseudomonadota bacterium]|uniref:Type III secretory protein EscS n=1 Tax=Pseudoalteromonas piratica TaxID=1348114 RepID=A0A0A7EMB8_9GAMM|nr:type III secretion system export apparatus subunit SctS [Pseudoalteromonas sp. MMG024]AIY67673.1 type III secretory protein EscS [Pseudoalteromonas piratica]MCF6455639.1 type III secretion system export apparatus subunit SctS [Pseudoalteromonas sp. MMG024]MEC8325385.1 type III secretion system export apparatus subunit SctS [Pseudomonadota bacterium]